MYSQLSKYNTIFRGQSGSPFPTAGLQAIVYPNSTYEDGGTTYIRTSKGIGLPVISGTGLNRIIDFAPLNDIRFDKGSYVGNAYGLPATYNYPYVGIYYDATSEATRYHWKITDFAFAVILAQSLLVDNMFFLKATATTDTSNVISTVDRLFIYSTALADNNLAKIKNYIGIQADFYGDNLIGNSTFDDSSWWDFHTGASALDGVCKFINVGLNYGIYRLNLLEIGAIYKLQFKILNYSSGIIRFKNICGNTFNANGNYEIQCTASGTHLLVYSVVSSTTLDLDDIYLYKFFQNYYKAD